ncbi:hypothetical protein ACT7DB_18470 [Bacillus cereus]
MPLLKNKKEFLQQHVKRGKKTAFANVMALDKGIVLPEHATDTEIQTILDEWVLIEYIDNGERNVDTPCGLSDRVAALIRRIIPIKSKIKLHILKHAILHQKSFNFLLFINISYDTERHPAFTASKI